MARATITIQGERFEVLESLGREETKRRKRRALGPNISRELILRKPKGRKIIAVLLDNKGDVATKLFEPSFAGLPKEFAKRERPIFGRTVVGRRRIKR